MTEGSNTGNLGEQVNLYNQSKLILSSGITFDSTTGVYSTSYDNSSGMTYVFKNFFNNYPESNGVVPGQKYRYVMTVTEFESTGAIEFWCGTSNGSGQPTRLDIFKFWVNGTGTYEFLVEGYDSDTYTFFSRDYLFVNAGVNLTSLKFTVELYEY